jgi:hypothetical protein
MFRNDKQTCAAIKVLLRSVRLERLWSDSGPTPQAVELVEQRGGAMSHGEALMVLAAFDFWNGRGKTELGDLLGVLDSDKLHLLGSLLVAVAQGPSFVDRWLTEHQS